MESNNILFPAEALLSDITMLNSVNEHRNSIILEFFLEKPFNGNK